jgi:RecG-like helicase
MQLYNTKIKYYNDYQNEINNDNDYFNNNDINNINNNNEINNINNNNNEIRNKFKFFFNKNNFRNKILNKLTFKLTKGQLDAINDIINDLKSGKPMNRLIQGVIKKKIY